MTDDINCPTTTVVQPRALPLLLTVAAGLSVANVYYAQPLLDLLARDYAVAPSAIGSVITATQFGSALALVFLVPLGDRVERRTLMVVQCACLIVALLIVAIAPSFPSLLASMLGAGLLGTAMTQGLIAYAASVAPSGERGRWVGMTQGGVVAGLLLARTLSGALADIAGWRCVYLVSAGLMGLVTIAVYRSLPTLAPPTTRLSYPRLIASMFTLLRRNRVLRVRGTLALLMFATFNIFWNALALPLGASPYDWSHTAIGALGLIGAVGALVLARAGAMVDRGRGEWVTGVALVVLLAAWIPLAWIPLTIGTLVIGILLLDAGGQAIHVANQGLVLATEPEAHGRLIGCYMLFYALGSGLGGAASTAAYTVAGWHGVSLLGAAVSAVALVFWCITRGRG